MPRRSQSEVRSVSMSTPSSEAERASVGSRIRATEEAALGIEPDALGVAEQVVHSPATLTSWPREASSPATSGP